MSNRCASEHNRHFLGRLLGVIALTDVAVDTEVTVSIGGVPDCGTATVRHSRPCSSGFRMGLQFQQSLFMQHIPGLDTLLIKSFRPLGSKSEVVPSSPLRRIGHRVSRMLRVFGSKTEKDVNAAELPTVL